MSTREHGTREQYRRGCHCEDCRGAERAYADRRNRLIAYGRWQPFTDAAPVREHVRALMDYGLGWIRIAELAGVPRGTVSHLLYGNQAHGKPPTHRIRTGTAQRLLAVQPIPANLAKSAVVEGTGSRRRLQALTAIGWSGPALAARLGMELSNLHRVMRGEQPVTAATAGRVRQLYDELWDQPPPQAARGERISAARTRAYAERRGWALPAAWDDEAIDDPSASPAEDWRRPARLGSAELAEEYRELAALGYTRAQAAERLGVSVAAIEKALERTREAA